MSIGPNVGTAHITIRPSLRGWSSQIRKELERETRAAGASLPGESGSRGAPAASTQRNTEAGRRAGTQFAGGFDRTVRTAIAKSLDKLPPMEIGAATSEADQKLRDLRVELETLGKKRVGVDIDSGEALAQVAAIKAQLTELANTSPDIQVQADTLGAAAQLEAISRQVALLAREDPTVTVDADTGAAVVQLTLLQRLVKRISGTRAKIWFNVDPSALGLFNGMASKSRILIGLFAALAPALIPVGAVALSLAASFTAAFTAASIGVGVLLGAVLGAIIPVIKAQQELEQKQDAATAAGRAYASAQQGVADAVRGVGDAERSAARAVADARRARADAIRTGDQQIVAAEDAVRDAVDNVRDAQDALNQARDDAREKLAAYRDQLRGAALDESGAALSVTAARDALNAALIDPASTQFDVDQAQQALDEAEYAYDQATKRRKGLKDQADKDRADGVSGDAAVVEARNNLDDATEALADAERNLGQARADAARAVADAQRNLDRARADGARQVAAAQEALSRAQDAAAQAGQDNADAQADLADTMSKLSGPAKVFVDALERAKDAWKAFVAATAGDSFGIAVQVLDMFSALLPNLVPLAKGAADAVGVLLDDLRDFGEGPAGQSFLDWLTKKAPGAIVTMGRAIGNIVKGISFLVGAVAESNTGFLDMTRRFSKWAENLGSNPGLKRFTDYVRRMKPIVGAALGAIAGAFVAILDAASPIGTIVLKVLTYLARKIAKVDPAILTAAIAALIAVLTFGLPAGVGVAIGALVLIAQKSQTVRDILKVLADMATVLWGVIKDLAAVLLDQLKKAFDDLQPSLNDLATVFREKLLPAWTDFWEAAEPILRWFIRTVVPIMAAGLKLLVKRIGYFAEILSDVLRFFTAVFTGKWSKAWDAVKDIAVDVLLFVPRQLRDMFGALGTLIKNSVIGRLFGRMWDAVKLAAGAAKDWILDRLVRGPDSLIGRMTSGFAAFKTGFQKLWNSLQDLAATPVKFIVDTVYNNGIRKVVNFIPGVSDIGAVDTSGWGSHAAGGVLPGHTPGRDVHRFVSPTAGVLNLGGGEGILTTRAVDQIGGAAGVKYLNDRAKNGTLSLRPLIEQSHAAGGVITVDGEPMSIMAAAQLAVAEQASKIAMSVIQGSYQKASSYSGTSHTGGGVMDTSPGNFLAQTWLRKAGFAAWARNIPGAATAGSGAHVHSVSLFDRAATGNSQAKAYLDGQDGLGGPDYGPRPRIDSALVQRAADYATQLNGGTSPLGNGGVHAIGGVGDLVKNSLSKFLNALDAVKDFVADAPGWKKKLTGAPWASMMGDMAHNVVDGQWRGWLNGKLPGSPLPSLFDQGGIARGAGMMMKRTIAPERVLSPHQTLLFDRQIDTLEGFDRGMRRLDQIGASTPLSSRELHVSRLLIEDWERGLALMELVAENAADEVYAGQSNHTNRMADRSLP